MLIYYEQGKRPNAQDSITKSYHVMQCKARIFQGHWYKYEDSDSSSNNNNNNSNNVTAEKQYVCTFYLFNNTSSSPCSSKYSEDHIVTVVPRSRIILESRITMKGHMPYPQCLACSKHCFFLLEQQLERVGISSPQRRQRAATCGAYTCQVSF